jgi:hypothetical protein
MNTTDQLALPVDPGAWERVLYSFLAEKEKKTGSVRTELHLTCEGR